MQIGEIGSIAQGAATLVAIGGFLWTLHKNGKAQAERDKKITKELATRDAGISNNINRIFERWDHKDTGLSALNVKVQMFQLHCANTSKGLEGRTVACEHDIRDLKSKRNVNS